MKGSQGARGTDELSSEKGVTCHDSEIKPTSEVHSRSVECRGKNKLVQRMKVSK
jgi:hypothetical protein